MKAIYQVKFHFITLCMLGLMMVAGISLNAQGTVNSALVTDDFHLRIDENTRAENDYKADISQLESFSQTEIEKICQKLSDQMVQVTPDFQTGKVTIHFPEQPEGAVSLSSLEQRNWYLDYKFKEYQSSSNKQSTSTPQNK